MRYRASAYRMDTGMRLCVKKAVWEVKRVWRGLRIAVMIGGRGRDGCSGFDRLNGSHSHAGGSVYNRPHLPVRCADCGDGAAQRYIDLTGSQLLRMVGQKVGLL